MPSDAAKKAAGTYIRDDVGRLSPFTRWVTIQCRYGHLAQHIRAFCEAQPESADPALVQVEAITSECIQCRIPCRLYDHESAHPYDSEVRFELDPLTGKTRRV